MFMTKMWIRYEPGHFKDKDDVSLTGLRLGRVVKEGYVLTVEPGW